MEALVLKGPRWCGRSTGQQLALAFRQTLARCRSAAVPGRAVLLLVLVHAHDRAELLVGRPIADDVVALGARPLLYALRNSAMHVSEQNSFLPVCVGRTYCSGSLPSPHQVHVARLAGLPRCRCVDAGDVVLPGDADVDVEEADAEEVAFVLAPGAAELLPLLVLLSRPPDMVSRVAVLVVALADSRRQAPWHLRRFRFRVFRSGGQIALRLP